MKIFLILVEHLQLTTRELYNEYFNKNPKSIPPFNNFSQLMKFKWFENLGLSDTYGNNGRARNAIWTVRDEFRQYPPQWTPQSGKLLHEGGSEAYAQEIEDHEPLSENIFDQYDHLIDKNDSCFWRDQDWEVSLMMLMIASLSSNS